MPITAEIIKGNETLKTLSDDQINAIVTVAGNTYKQDWDDAHGTNMRRWDEDIKGLWGKEKPTGEDGKPLAAHKYLKLAWSEREKEWEAKVAAAAKGGSGEEARQLKEKIADLEAQLKDAGLKGSELLRQDIEGYKNRLKDYETLVEDTKKERLAERKEFETKLAGAQRTNLLLEVGFERAQALMGLEFDTYIVEEVRNTVIESKWQALLARYTPEKVVNEKNETVTQWRDKDGKVVRSTANNMEPATTRELFLAELKPILKAGRQQAGTGTGAGTGSATGSSLDLRGARTQVDADNAITNHLIAQGMQRGTTAFTEAFTKIRKENEALYKGQSALPLR